MHRRQVLQVGAALATLPLAGCGASAPDPKPALADTKDATDKDKVDVNDKAGGGDRDPAASPGNDAAADTHDDQGAGAGKNAAADAANPEAPKSTFSRVVAKVGRNHGHVLAVSFTDVQAGVEKTYELAGTSGHPHTITLSPDEMKNLLGGQIVRTTTTRDRGHLHRVVMRCAPPVDPPEWTSACTVTFNSKDEHELVIPAADLAAKAEKTYDIQGLAGHTHEVTLTAGDFEKLARAEVVSRISTRGDAHTHVVLIHRKPTKA